MKLEFNFNSGKCVTVTSECRSIAEFIERNGTDGVLPTMLAFENDGIVINTSCVDWIGILGE